MKDARKVKLPINVGTTRQGRNVESVPIAWGKWKGQTEEEMAPLVLGCWKAGIEAIHAWPTNRMKTVQIDFATAGDARAFLNLVVKTPGEYAWGSDQVEVLRTAVPSSPWLRQRWRLAVRCGCPKLGD